MNMKAEEYKTQLLLAWLVGFMPAIVLNTWWSYIFGVLIVLAATVGRVRRYNREMLEGPEGGK